MTDRERLIRQLLARRGLGGSAPAAEIPRRPAGVPVPLSPSQEGMWFLDRLLPGNPAYVLGQGVRLTGPVDPAAMRASAIALTGRHEALRTRIRAGNQDVLAAAPDPLTYEDRPGADPAAIVRRECETPFDLAEAPLLRIRLVRLGPDDHLLTVAVHHIVADEVSLGVILDELLDGHRRHRAGEPAAPPPDVQFGDWVLWQRDRASGEAESFWAAHLAGTAVLDLPTDRPRPATPSTAGATRAFTIAPELAAEVDALARRTGATRFMIFLTALQVVLARLSGQHDVCVGSPVSLRSGDHLDRTVGLFVNSLPLRTDLSGDPALDEALARVRRTTMDSLAHAALPFDRIVELAAPPRDPGRNPLFQTMLVLNRGGGVRERHGLTVRPVPVRRDTSRLDLTIAIHEFDAGLGGLADYNTDLFDESTVDRLIDRLWDTVHAMAVRGDARLSELDTLTAGERRDLTAWNDTALDVGAATTLHALVVARAAATPDALAVLEPGRAPLTYGALDRRSAALAGRLRALGVRRDTPVGLLLPSGADAIVAVLAILRAGAGYLPLDPAAPPARSAALLSAAGAAVTIASGSVPGFHGTVVRPDDPATEGNEVPAGVGDHPDQLAYVVYTSGSTGAPKGVMVAHRTAVTFARGFAGLHGLTADDRLLMIPPLSFDASVGDLFPALITGAALVVHPDPATINGPELLRLCREYGITVVDTAAPLWSSWTSDLQAPGHPLPGPAGGAAGVAAGPLRAVLVGGEPVPVAQVRRWAALTRGRVPLYNHYGPTEATVCATTYTTVDAHELPGLTHLPIGRPVPNVRVHLLDDAMRPVPVGRPGEVYIGGMAPTRGYLGAPGATAVRFVPDPFGGEPGARLYRTGDLARHRSDGTLQFLGRTDRQIKIRGYRIEPGEIEAACASLPGIRQAAVVAADHPTGRRLIAYLVPVPAGGAPDPAGGTPDPAGGAPDPVAVRARLREMLPDHLVPTAVVVVPELPTTRHGKLDTAALPTPADAPARPAHVPPRTPVERVLADVWADLLDIGPVGRHDNFFDLGGHSLLAARFTARAEAVLGRPVPLPLVFGTADLAALAAALDAGDRPGTPAEDVLRADARLPADLHLAPAGPLLPVTDVLFTGATGFLGAYLLADWLRHTTATVHCLVRAAGEAAATARVEDNLRRYGLWHPSFGDRLAGVPGDLAAPAFGLTAHDFAALGARVQVIVHNGGVVDFLRPYAALKPANVGGTLTVLRLAAHGDPSDVHLVSTLGVFLTPARRLGLVREGDAPDDCTGLGGYNATKWAADALVRAARDRGLRVSVHRPARVSGHSVTGAGNTGDYFSRLLATCVQLGAVPDLDDRIDLSPVDYVAAGIGLLTRDRSTADHHYYNNRTMSFGALAGALTSFGHRAELVPYPRWRAALLDRPDAALAAFAPLFGPDTPVRTQPDFDCTGTEARLAAAGIVCPAADERLLHTYLKVLADD
ncbi:non-ribosomal peptide synthetase [Catenuloplanes indicus]|uniref:Amino acid adenylation domain-containing protein/thioester reductase-like protein n=1 Tax=Catenuloplanes indicus TaxID=137267 RepID=A0AAE3VUI0_9ACTN|nr:non-ribosomal peptide synthetase [Catenuloplanes indicus]MDQ0364071.1 amino acid adenylation domain-containing protein/thioester reductase-like protein [Catenuloplanes indicus]